MHEITDRQHAELLTTVADAKDESESIMGGLREKHQPAIDALKADAQAKRDQAQAVRKGEQEGDADALEAEAETIEADAEAYKQDVNRCRDLCRQITLVEAAQSQPEALDAMLSDFEIRARHDLPGSQYVAKSITEQAQAEMRDLLDRRMDDLRTEQADVQARLDGRAG